MHAWMVVEHLRIFASIGGRTQLFADEMQRLGVFCASPYAI
jgi:hypothetical protein